LQLSTSVQRRAGVTFRLLVSPTPTLSRGGLVPPVTMDFLSSGRGPRPGRPGWRSAEPPRSARFTYFGAFLPSLSPFTSSSGCPSEGGRCSPGFPAPPKLSPPAPWILRPAQTLRFAHTSAPEGPDVRPGGPQPSKSGEPPQASKSLEDTRRRLPTSFEAGPRHLSAAAPSLLAFGDTRPKPSALTFRASKYAGSGVSPWRCLLPWGSLPPHQPRGFDVPPCPGFSRRIHRAFEPPSPAALVAPRTLEDPS